MSRYAENTQVASEQGAALYNLGEPMTFFCIFHANCADGFAAAWAVREALGDIEFYGGIHQDPPPDVTGRDVIMVDFAYKRPVLDEMAQKARTLLILDHHKSAYEDLQDMPSLAPGSVWDHWNDMAIIPEPTGGIAPRAVFFDLERSGAGITWDFFHDALRPPLIDHIEDRDLWRFELEGTREIQAALFSYPYDFRLWSDLMECSCEPDWLEGFRIEGEAIERKHFKDIHELIASAQRRMVIGGHNVPVLNAPYFYSSDAGHLMAQGEPFAACYWDAPDGRNFSLRSSDTGVDVSEIARQYGGGGHRNAAGFRVEIGWEGDPC